MDSTSRMRAWFPALAGVAGITSLLVGVGVLLGWAFDIRLLKTLLPGLPRMPANTALAFVSLGLSLLLLRDRQAGPMGRRLGQLFALLTALFGLLVVSEYIFGWDLGIDQLLFLDDEARPLDMDVLPGRPALDTALSFIFMGLALLFLDRKVWRGFYPAELLLVIGAILPLMTLIGYVDAARAIYGMPVEVPHYKMSLHTSLTFLFLSAGGMAARPERGLIKLLREEGPGTTMTRYLLLAVILLPLAVALLLIVGDLAGFHLPRLLLLLVTLAIALVAIVLLWSVARLLNRENEEKKATREALRQSEERLRQLIESAPDGIFVADVEGRYTDVNPSGAQMLGFTREEIVGKTIMDFIQPEEVPRLWAHQKRLLDGDTGVNEWRFLNKSGEYVHIEVSDIILPDGRWQGLVRDISERKALEEKLQRLYEAESSERAWLRQVINQMPEGVVLSDEQGRMTIYNQAARALSAGEAAQIDTTEQPILFDVRSAEGEPLSMERRPLGRAMREGESIMGAELTLRTRDGRLVPVLANAAPIKVPGQEGRKAAVLVFQDISQIKELERQREEWISVVAHDLRQPLSAILLAAQILRRRAEHLNPTQLRSVDNILTSIKQQRKMIDDLLDVSRIQTRQVKLERQEADLATLLPEILERAGGLTGGREVRLFMEGEAPEGAWQNPSGPAANPGQPAGDSARRPGEVYRRSLRASVDPVRFEQVLGNLLSNAAKYGFAGTGIEVRLARRGSEAEISVTNQGQGISPEEQQSLFVRFYRTSSARADEQVKGLGLGLYICKGLVEAHGGRLWVESIPSQTTTFFFTLPLSLRP